ncbi:hypothetical protein B0H63DRAFT_96041 [Podospora didyma]|uniref:Uncharacterized protein n=1 Tax=Podospora didyma TaxID=330526 RepID=A0AAE0NWY1_9PEZI|nr:hypothetical protein B0H63DRAFT_96041 [Podospora didyma]
MATHGASLFSSLLLFCLIFIGFTSCRVITTPRPLIENHHIGVDIDNPFYYPSTYNDQVKVSVLSGPQGNLEALELAAARRALKKLKDLLGPEKLKELLKDDIAAGWAEWHDIISSSSSSSTEDDHVVAEVRLTAIPRPDICQSVDFSARNFVGWFADSGFNHVDKLWAGHPEHYGVHLTPNADGTMRGELIEPWGPLLTYSVIPRFTPVVDPAVQKKPWMRALPGFPLQMVGDETLMDGSGVVVGNLHFAFRDIPVSGSVSGEKKTCGVEVVLAMWMVGNTPPDVVEGMRQHLAVEYANWFPKAFDDIRTGAFKP